MYKQYREDTNGDKPFDNDDITQIDDDDYQSYQAIEFNRGTTVITIFVNFFVGLFYFLAGMAAPQQPRRVGAEAACGCAMLFVSVMSFAGSGYWLNRMKRDFYEDREDQGYKFSNEINCSAGCALQLANAFWIFGLALLMLALAYVGDALDDNTTTKEEKETLKADAKKKEDDTSHDVVYDDKDAEKKQDPENKDPDDDDFDDDDQADDDDAPTKDSADDNV